MKNNPQFEFIEHDVTCFVNVEGGLDYILHFASPASPIDYLKIPIQTLKVGSSRDAQFTWVLLKPRKLEY